MIEQMDKAAARTIAAAMKAALAAVEADLGVTIEVGGGSYDPTGEFTPKVRVKLAGADRAAFEKYAPMVGLDPADFGREFSYNGKTVRISGLNLRAPRFPVILTDVKTGKTYKAPEDSVRLRLRQAS
jgi:hypothetical protein